MVFKRRFYHRSQFLTLVLSGKTGKELTAMRVRIRAGDPAMRDEWSKTLTEQDLWIDLLFIETGHELRRSRNRYVRAAGLVPPVIQTYMHLRLGLANNVGVIRRYGKGE